ncbi:MULTISPECIES: VC0807 family protein [Kitasatospora]|uniref:Intracellular septation protein A n=1 Tax=Kitasatospora cystarginea TaxID=58350 RepID=A0ABN3E907_9ACTN
MSETSTPTAEPAQKQKTARARRHLIRSLVFELGIPVGGYYLLHGLGLGQWAALTISSLLVLPWLLYGMIRNRRVELMPVFALVLMTVGALMSLVTGSPRTLLIRDSWLIGVLGVWVLGTLPTRRPFMLTASRSVVAAKIGEDGAQEWLRNWDRDPAFRRHIRLLTAFWGCGFTVDAGVRVVLACTLPVDSVPLVSTLQWLVVLGGMLGYHNWYVTRHGLKV